MSEEVILVDSSNRQIGTMEKMEAHIKGELHRAFSIFVFNEEGKMLLHQRTDEKYHCGGLWTNAVCSHPKPGEKQVDALKRKMDQEMGFYSVVEKAFDFKYRAELGNGLIEHEYDEVYFAVYNGGFSPNPEEVKDYRFASIENIRSEIAENPELFTPWFKMLFERMSLYFRMLKRV